MPLVPLTVLTTLLHVYMALRLTPALMQAGGAWALLLPVALAVSALCMPLPFVQRPWLRSAAGRRAQWLGLTAMGWFSSLLLLTLARDIGLLLATGVHWVGLADLDLPRWQQASAWAALGLATAVSVVGYFNARRTATVRHVQVPIARLPQQLHGFTIAQLSDIHVGHTIGRAYIQRIVERVNALKADMVAITGDLVDGTVAELREHIAPLGQLRARHGTFVVTGNHEYYAGAQPWIDELRRLGLHVLLNEHVVLQTRNVQGAQTDEEVLESALVVAGVTDYTAGHFIAEHASDPQRALWDAPPLVHTRVLLAHQPRSAPAAVEADFTLQLSGHTHGGQFFPWNLFVPLQQPFTAGLHRVQQKMWIYISRGTGYWGPPKRFGAPSEIALITLTCER
ncbi:metallophosphoesterase [Xenophilus arseniciresistens]|uniref:Metallophosphoesterase n=1 Tax=Xenophilus arseniciresistens TaxID=1283306 RepID=A0AAE3NAJ5_9BURK|nr:metallophosphoesterase [Xenophilus arseniciresistens]MDA7419160.1 metallophosphoesterase [Xenophilus arseniciresistens]